MPVTSYIWDELSDTLLMEKDEAGNTTTAYTYEPGQYGPLISQRRGGQTSYYHFDGEGSTRHLTVGNENVTDSYSWTAFGEPVAASGTNTNPFGYRGALGYYSNPETNDLYVRTRVYTPAISIWMSQDKYLYIEGVNGYVYVQNSPLSLVDPSGTQSVWGHVSDRGRFVAGGINTTYVPPTARVPGDMGSFVNLYWQPNVDQFHVGQPGTLPHPKCCLCKEIGFAQVIKTEGWWYARGGHTKLHYLKDWHIDTKIPYPYGGASPATRKVCPLAPGSYPTWIQLYDTPGPEPAWMFGNRLLIAFSQVAEVCAICTVGREALALPQKAIYGCITWSHSWHRTGGLVFATGFAAEVCLGRECDRKDVPGQINVNLDHPSGEPPTVVFLEHVSEG